MGMVARADGLIKVDSIAAAAAAAGEGMREIL